MKTVIECHICGKEFKRITRTHLEKHDITTEEYKNRFPGAAIVSEELSEKLGKASKTMSTERREICARIARQRFGGKPKSEEHRRKLSESRTGRSWGSHTDEHKEKMRHISRERMQERRAAGWVPPPLNSDQKEKLSKAVKMARAAKYWRGPANKGQKLDLSEDQRKNRSLRRCQWLANNPTTKTNTSIEIKMKDCLQSKEITYQHQFILETRKGSFIFDFYLEDRNLLVEVDGEYWHSKDAKQVNRDKLKERLAKEMGYRFLRVSDEDWRPELVDEADDVIGPHNAAIIEKRERHLKFD